MSFPYGASPDNWWRSQLLCWSLDWSVCVMHGRMMLFPLSLLPYLVSYERSTETLSLAAIYVCHGSLKGNCLSSVTETSSYLINASLADSRLLIRPIKVLVLHCMPILRDYHDARPLDMMSFIGSIKWRSCRADSAHSSDLDSFHNVLSLIETQRCSLQSAN